MTSTNHGSRTGRGLRGRRRTTTGYDAATADEATADAAWAAGPIASHPPVTRAVRRRQAAQPAGWIPAAQRAPAPVAPTPQPPPRRTPTRDLEGLYELRTSPHPTTTRQVEALNIALAGRPAPLDRLLAGINVRTGAAESLDPFVSYADDNEPQFTSTIVSLLGDVGKGKSQAMKSLFCLRPLLLGHRVVVLDKKRQGAEGEYAPLARAMGTEPVKFTPGGGPGSSCISLVDPRIGIATADGGATSDGRPAGQLELISQVIATHRGAALTELESEALRVGLLSTQHRAAAQDRAPVIADLIWCLQHPDPDLVRELYDTSWTVTQLLTWGTTPAAALLGLVTGPLGGIIDRPTSPEVSIDHPSGLTVFDISALPTSGPALSIVMLLIQTWLAALLAQRSAAKQKTILNVEEAWHIAASGLGEMFKETAKLSRALGLELVSGSHHPSDMPPDSPARALIQESSTLLLFAQDKPDDITETLALAGLPAHLADVLGSLPRGQCILVRTGADPCQVQIVASDFELELGDTNAQLAGDPDDEDAVIDELADPDVGGGSGTGTGTGDTVGALV